MYASIYLKYPPTYYPSLNVSHLTYFFPEYMNREESSKQKLFTANTGKTQGSYDFKVIYFIINI